MELEWLKKVHQAALMPVELRKLVDHDQREIHIRPSGDLWGLPKIHAYYKPSCA